MAMDSKGFTSGPTKPSDTAGPMKGRDYKYD
jgi:hypothetical protein